jgi:hypothetical protein
MHRRGRYVRMAMALGLWFAASVWASPGVMLRNDVMHAAASAHSAAAGRVAKGAAVAILRRQGGWIQIRSAGKTGWVRLLSVRGGVSTQSNALEEAKGLFSLGERRAEPNRVVATAGLRGLTEEDLKGAHFNAKQLQQLDNYAVSKEEARRFASEAGLAHRNIAYLPAPEVEHKNNSSSGVSIW